jgi:hypothetical protein
MKLILIFLLLIPLRLFAPGLNELVILRPEPINPYEAIWKAVCKVESNNNPYALNYFEGSFGIAQIRQCRLKHFKAISGINYTLTDMYSPEKSKIVFMAYAERIGANNPERICREWNGGPNGMRYNQTKSYYLKVKKYL